MAWKPADCAELRPNCTDYQLNGATKTYAFDV